jgi:hypothetical protein
MYHRPVFNRPEGNTFPALSNLQYATSVVSHDEMSMFCKSLEI